MKSVGAGGSCFVDTGADPLVEVEVARAWPHTRVGPTQVVERVGVKLASGGMRVLVEGRQQVGGEAGFLSFRLATERREDFSAEVQASIPLTSTLLLKPR